MTSIGTGYDLSSSTYSPDGRLFQIEYAQKAVDTAQTLISIKTAHGILLALQNPVTSPLLIHNRKMYSVDTHIGLVLSLYSDMTQRASLASGAMQSIYWLEREWRLSSTGQPTPCQSQARYSLTALVDQQIMADRISGYVQAYTLYSSVRPFGCSVTIACSDGLNGTLSLFWSYTQEEAYSLWTIEPSGEIVGHKANATGKGKQIAKTQLEKLDFSTLTLDAAVLEACKIMYAVHDEAKDKAFMLEMSWLMGGKFAGVPKDVVEKAESEAKRLAEDGMDED